MIYRTLGRTGLKVSQLGFGAMRLPMTEVDGEKVVNRDLAVPMIHRAFEAGLNYIDTAVGYCNEDSQRAVGAALKGWRDKIVLSTKNHYYGDDEKQWWAHLENSLERLDVDYIDIYNHHGINWKRYEEDVEPRVSKWMLAAKDQGLIRHICTSFHDD
ncbi:MAG: aldo/keto reductase, partial [Anaerolineae bacterium]|nr:aldo/keto reductase [Anaerolineae bacterium]